MEIKNTMVVSPHPILAAAGREIINEPFAQGETITEYLERTGVVIDYPAILTLNGVVVPADRWAVVCPRQGQLIEVRAIVQGGGGSDMKRAILTIVVMLVAGYIVAPMAGAVGSFGYAAAYGVTMFAGMSLVNTLAPLPQPNLSGGQGAGKNSPTYALTGGSNRQRPYEPLPLLYGAHRLYPDVAAKAYTSFAGDDQYINLAFNYGLGDLVIDNDTLKIGDTLISVFEGVTLYTSGADGLLPEFPGNVDTISGDDLTAAAGWVTRTGSINTTALEIDLAGSLFAIGEVGTLSLSAKFAIEYRRLDGPVDDPLAAWQGYGVDIVTTYTHYWSFGYWYDGAWVQKRYSSEPSINYTEGAWTGLVYSVPNPPYLDDIYLEICRWRAYTDLVPVCVDGVCHTDPAPPETRTETQPIIRNADRQPVRRTYRIDRLPAGQYEVRVERVTADEAADSAVSIISWSQLRSFQLDDGNYADQTRFGLRIKATAQLNGQIDRFNAVAAHRILVWTGAIWERQITSNPAWCFLDFAYGSTDADGKRLYGANVPYADIDLDSIKEWALFCDTNSLTFNGVIDRAMSAGQVLDALAACGRAVRSMGTGKLGVVYEYSGAPVVATFGMPNIKAGSFNVDYVSETLADAVEVGFVNASTGYLPDSVTANVPGVTSPINPRKLELFGCTNENMAGRFANLMAARNLYQRRRITFETDIEGLAVQRGEVVMLSHDVTAWGLSGRLVAGTTTLLTLDKAVPFTVAASHYITITQPNGTLSDHDVTYQVGSAEVIEITPALTVAPDTDKPIDYKWIFSDTAAPGKRVKIAEIKPVNDNTVRLVCFDDDPNYYAAESGTYIYTPPVISSYLAPRITGITFDEDLLDFSGLSRVYIVMDTTGSVDSIDLRAQFDNGPWQSLGTINGRTHQLDLRQGTDLRIEASPASQVVLTEPQNAQGTYTVVGTAGAMTDVSGFSVSASGGFALAVWDLHTIPAVRNGGSIRIRHTSKLTGQAWSDGIDVGPAIPGNATSAMLPLLAGTYMARAIDSSGLISPGIALAVTTVPTALNYNAVEVIDEALTRFTGVKTNVGEYFGALRLAGAVTIASMTTPVSEWGYITSLGGIVGSGEYQFGNAIDLGGIYSSRVTANIDALAYDADDRISVRGYVSAWPSVSGINVDDAGVQLQLRTTEDDPAASPVWSEWKPFTIGDYLARAMEFRLLFSSAATNHNVDVTGLAVTVDMADRVDGQQGVTVPTTGLALVYSPPFRATPALGITILDMQAGDVLSVTAETEAGATVQITNGGSGVQRIINTLAKGYGQKI